jgi:hypothetical protein
MTMGTHFALTSTERLVARLLLSNYLIFYCLTEPEPARSPVHRASLPPTTSDLIIDVDVEISLLKGSELPPQALPGVGVKPNFPIPLRRPLFIDEDTPVILGVDVATAANPAGRLSASDRV